MDAANLQFDEAGNFYFVILAYYTAVSFPAIYYLWPPKSPELTLKAGGCRCIGCRIKATEDSDKRAKKERNMKACCFGLAFVFGCLFFQAFKFHDAQNAMDNLNTTSVAPPLKERYNYIGQPHASLALVSLLVLTTEEFKENGRKLSNPQPMDGVALPKWMVTEPYAFWLLAIYFSITFISFPSFILIACTPLRTKESNSDAVNEVFEQYIAKTLRNGDPRIADFIEPYLKQLVLLDTMDVPSFQYKVLDNLSYMVPMFVQGLWPNDSPLKQLPRISERLVGVMNESEVFTCRQLAELAEEERRGLLEDLEDDDYEDVLRVLEGMPNMTATAKIMVPDERGIILPGSMAALRLTLSRTPLLGGDTSRDIPDNHIVHAPYYPREKGESWYLYLINSEDNILKSCSFLPRLVNNTATVDLSFFAPFNEGVYKYQCFVKSDSYIDAGYSCNIIVRVSSEDP